MPGTMTKESRRKKHLVPVDSSSSELGKATAEDAKNTKEQRTLYSHVYASLLWAKPEDPEDQNGRKRCAWSGKNFQQLTGLAVPKSESMETLCQQRNDRE